MTRDERKRRMNIALMIDMRDRCEDIWEKMEAKQSRRLDRGNVFPFRSCIQLSRSRRGISHFPVETPVLRLVGSNQFNSKPILI